MILVCKESSESICKWVGPLCKGRGESRHRIMRSAMNYNRLQWSGITVRIRVGNQLTPPAGPWRSL